MKTAKPFGDVNTATILVIGHDPRLQRGKAEAEFAFFFDYLTRPRPGSRPEAKKYDLAQAVVDYAGELAGREVALTELYVTNLCNQFLDHAPGSGTVLIPVILAQRGVEQIVQTVAAGQFKVIIPMAVQTFCHLCKQGFLDEESELVKDFVQAARPQPNKAEEGIYQQSGRAPFLAVCGHRFHHCGVPVVPVVHVKQWPLKPRMVRYTEPMERAQRQISQLV
ncbi:MAG: hypothetical protein IMY83_02205 [Chloroflexi bacterium]|nr:hypothetical protein [Chloroflexota bacterium]